VRRDASNQREGGDREGHVPLDSGHDRGVVKLESGKEMMDPGGRAIGALTEAA